MTPGTIGLIVIVGLSLIFTFFVSLAFRLRSDMPLWTQQHAQIACPNCRYPVVPPLKVYGFLNTWGTLAACFVAPEAALWVILKVAGVFARVAAQYGYVG